MDIIKEESDEEYLSYDFCFICLQSVLLNIGSDEEKVNLVNLFFKHLKIGNETQSIVCEGCGEDYLAKFFKLYNILEKARLEMDYSLDSIKTSILSSNGEGLGVAPVRKMVVEKCLKKMRRKPQIILEKVDASGIKKEESLTPADCGYSLPNWDEEIEIPETTVNEITDVKPGVHLEAKSKRVMKNIRKLKCAKCSKRFRYKNSLKFHYEAVHVHDLHRNPFNCSICPKLLGSNAKLLLHVNAVHLKLKPYKCDVCDKSYATPYQLRVHMATPHNSEGDSTSKSFSCEICGSAFHTIQSLKQHGRVHEEKRFKCDICNKTFRKPGQLKEHVSSVHNKQRYYCQVPGCGKSYTQRGTLSHHLRLQHPDFRIEETETKKEVKTNSLECEQCSIKFGNMIDLRQHIRDAHAPASGSKKLVCEMCGHTTSCKWNLQKHIESNHKNSNKVECEFCKKHFNPLYLSQHLRIVHGPKKYKCGECSYATNFRLDYNKHIKRHEGGGRTMTKVEEEKLKERHLKLGVSQDLPKRSYKCEAEGCGKSYKNPSAIIFHYRIEHPGLDIPGAEESVENVQKE